MTDHNQDYHTLIASQQTLQLATSASDGSPHISYAPYVRDNEGRFYIFVSQLAAHTKHIQESGKAAVMFIRPEQESENLHARVRATFQCSVEAIDREDPLFAEQMTAMTEQFGDIIKLLYSLPDFHLFRLTPISGQFIAGFGQAFEIDVANDLIQVK